MKCFVLIFLAILLIACNSEGSDGSNGGLRGASSNETTSEEIQSTDSLISQIAAPVDQSGMLPKVDGLDGRIVFTQGNTNEISGRIGSGGVIGLAHFDGQPARLIADRVHPATVKVSPSGRYVGFAAVDFRTWKIYTVDLDFFENDPSLEEADYLVPLWEGQHQFSFVDGWSPDENWVMLRPAPNVVISNNDGSIQYELGTVLAFWLTDNRVLAIELDQPAFNETDRQVIDSYIFNPATDTRTQIDPGFTVFNLLHFQASEMKNLLETHNLELFDYNESWHSQFGRPFAYVGEHFLNAIYNRLPTLSRTCNEVVLTSNITSSPLYVDSDIFALTDFQADASGNTLFLRWLMTECGFSIDQLTGEIVSISAEGELSVLARNVFIGKEFSSVRASVGKKFDLSPDGRHMIYISGGINSFNTTINLLDLETGASTPIASWTSGNSEDFIIREAYTSVFWAPQ